MSIVTIDVGEFTIVQGEYLSVPMVLRDSADFAYDLTSQTEITARFPKSDGTALEKKYSTSGVTIVDAKAGRITAILTATDTNNLKTGLKQNFEVKVEIGATNIRYFQFSKNLNVNARDFA